MPNDKDGWAKLTEEQRKEKIVAVIEEMIGKEMAARSQIFIIKAREKVKVDIYIQDKITDKRGRWPNIVQNIDVKFHEIFLSPSYNPHSC